MDKAKELLGFKYDFSKRVALAMIYGLSAWGVERQHNEAGFPVKKGYGEGFYNSFWEVLPAAHSFLQAQIKTFEKAFKRKEPVCNLFGTPLPSGKPKDAGNRIIQSSVSSFIRMFCYTLFTTHQFKHFIRLVCIIHDELVIEIKKEHVEEFRAHSKMCLDIVNEIVGFSYPLGLGFKVVHNFYAK
jgi:DNA polymerase I-like protein with 3'-5' exonuclease and polymerase domains